MLLAHSQHVTMAQGISSHGLVGLGGPAGAGTYGLFPFFIVSLLSVYRNVFSSVALFAVPHPQEYPMDDHVLEEMPREEAMHEWELREVARDMNRSR